MLAQVLTPRTRLALQQQPLKRVVASANTRVPMFITVDDDDALARLAEQGVTLNARFGRLCTAQVPLRSVGALTGIAGLRSAQIATTMSLSNDSARFYSNVDAAHVGTAFESPYLGEGVLVAIIDTGIDFNHVNFRDEDGNSRVEAVYMPDDSTGVAPVVEGLTLPGSCYESREAIADLTTDTPNASHGTHTTGTAAGSYRGNAYYGVAPEARLLLCGLTELTDVNIANSLKYIADFADRKQMPVVVNMSFGSHEGAHDGTSPLCQVFDQVSGPGRICVISAANDGHLKMHLSRTFGTADTLRTTIASNSNRGGRLPGYVSIWSDDNRAHDMRLAFVNRNTGEEVFHTPFVSEIPTDSVLIITSDEHPEMAPYFTGKLLLAAGLEDNGKYHSVAEFELQETSNVYRLSLQLTGPRGSSAQAWVATGNVFTRSNISGYETGTTVGSISDLCTGEQAISVGAYCSKRTTPLATGGLYWHSRSTPPDIAYFSSYGPDARGISRPEICAPGLSMVSSGNRYDTNPSSSITGTGALAEMVNEGGVDYPYGPQGGTSMSAPVVTGTIALWLQANPQLSPATVREVLKNTALRDSYVIMGDEQRWGYGKIDAEEGLRYLTQTGVATVAASTTLLPPLRVYDMMGRLVSVLDSESATSALAPGIYMLVSSQGGAKRICITN